MDKNLIWTHHSNIDIQNMPYRKGYRRVTGAFEFAVDRFGIAQGLLEIDVENIVKTPVYDLNNTTSDWRSRYFDTIDAVANKVYNQAGDNKTIYVLYSGGLDSLCVLTALKRNKRYKEFLNQGRIRVSMTSMSIQENPGYFFKAILPTMPIHPLDFSALMNDDNALLVTGDLGDFVIGSSDSLYLTNNNTDFDLMTSWTKFFDHYNNISEGYTELAKQAKINQPFDIESTNQMTWWMSQCYCYQDEIVRPYIWSNTNNLSALANDSKVFRFFYDDLITTFSYEYMATNPIINKFDDARKFPKEYVATHTKNNFVFGMKKVYSQRLTLRTINKTSIYIENGEFKFTADQLNG